MRKVTIERVKKIPYAYNIMLVLLDNEIERTLRNGQSVSFEVSDNKPHKIQCYVEYEYGKKVYSDLVYVESGLTNINLVAEALNYSIKLYNK